MKSSAKQNKYCKYLLLLVMILIMTFYYYNHSDIDFHRDASSITGVIAAKNNFDMAGRKYGLAFMNTVETVESFYYENSKTVYEDPTLWGGNFKEYDSAIGLQGWIFHYLAKLPIPYPLHAFGLGLCLALAIVIVFICYELSKKYGFVMAGSFYFVTMFSHWVIKFSPNLFWMEFTIYLPMLLGLICLNHLEKRKWLYPLFFISIAIRSATGYDFIPVIMLSSIMFLVAECIISYKSNKKHAILLFKATFGIGVASLLGLAFTLVIHSLLRGGGNLISGFTSMWDRDVLRRFYGSASDFDGVYSESLNASALEVVWKFLWEDYNGIYTGKIALFLLVFVTAIFVYQFIRHRKIFSIDLLLFIGSFITCISWFVIGKSASYLHPHIYYNCWYIGYMQISVYLVMKFLLSQLFTYVDTNKIKTVFSQMIQEIESEVKVKER